jgi:hypothetical protein
MTDQTTLDDVPADLPGRHKNLAEQVAPWLAGLLLATPVLVAYYPPMTDLAFHEAGIGLLRHRNDPALVPPGLYLLNLGEPNQLFYLLGWALSYVVSTRWAAKLLVAAAVLAIPVFAARFARYAGSSRLAALLVAPMALGWLFSWGLIANLVGLAALLAVLPSLDRFAERPTWRRAVLALGGVLLLYLAHEAMMFVYGGMAILLALLSPGPPRLAAVRLLPAAFVVVVHEAFIHWVQQFVTPTVRGVPIQWASLAHKLERVPYILVPATDPVVQLAMFALCILTVATFFWLRTAERRALFSTATLPGSTLTHPASTSTLPGSTSTSPISTSTNPGPSTAHARLSRARAFAYAHRWEAFALACFALYLAFPATLSGSTLVYQRFFPPAYAVLAAVAAPRDLWAPRGRIARLSAFALPAATLLVCWPSFVDSSREYRALEDIIAAVEPGSAMAEIDLGPGDPSRAYSLGPASGRVLATRGGRLSYSFSDSPIFPMVVAQPSQWNESLSRLGFDTWSLRPAHDLHLFKYILLRTTDPRLELMATLALHAEAEYVTESGEWVLLRSRLPLVSPTSGEVLLESPPPETIRDRINAMVATLRGEAPPQVPAPEPAATNGRGF